MGKKRGHCGHATINDWGSIGVLIYTSTPCNAEETMENKRKEEKKKRRQGGKEEGRRKQIEAKE